MLPLDQLHSFLAHGGVSSKDLNFALTWHASKGDIPICDALLSAGADVSCIVEELSNSSPLRYAAIHGEDVARFLLTKGASIHVEGIVMTADLYGHFSLVKLLVLSGADFESPCAGETPLEAIRVRGEGADKDRILHFLETEAKTLRIQKYSNVEQETDIPGKSAAAPQVRVMMSYCWDNQSVVMSIVEYLRRNKSFSVWIDVDHMYGSTLDSMARAVEEADVVVLGVSEGYCKSTNCRLEAEYATIRRKTLIPLILEENYRYRLKCDCLRIHHEVIKRFAKNISDTSQAEWVVGAYPGFETLV